MKESSGYSNIALWSLGLGIVGLACPFLGLFSFLALILGALEWREVAQGRSSERNRGFAITGVVLGSIGSLIALAAVVYLLFEAASAVLQFLQEAMHSKWF